MAFTPLKNPTALAKEMVRAFIYPGYHAAFLDEVHGLLSCGDTKEMFTAQIPANACDLFWGINKRKKRIFYNPREAMDWMTKEGVGASIGSLRVYRLVWRTRGGRKVLTVPNLISWSESAR